jgi:thiamine biosynthesis lipoprotein
VRIALLLIAAVSTTQAASAAVVRLGQPVMGTVLEVTVVARDEADARRWAEESIAEARRWDDLLTTWRPEGELARLNARAGEGPVPISPELAAALRRMLDLSRATGGTFDPGVGPLVRLWSSAERPSPEALAKLGPHRIANALVLRSESADLARGAELDAGGIGKGMALDAIAAKLRAYGVDAAFLDFGGSSLLAIGAPPGSPDGWRIALSGAAPNVIHGEMFLLNAAVSTSHAAGAGAAEGPIVDPRSGAVVPGPRLVTVVTREAAAAEAWSKAVIVLGTDAFAPATAAGMEVLYDDGSIVRRSEHFPLLASSR